MKGEILNLSGSPIDGLVRLEDRGTDNRGRRLLWLHTAMHILDEPWKTEWNPMPEDPVYFPPKPNGPDGSRWPIWAICPWLLDGDLIHSGHCETPDAPMWALLESGGLAATAEDPVVLVQRLGREPNDGCKDAGKRYPSVHLTTGTPESFRWLLDAYMIMACQGELPRKPIVILDTSLAYARGWLQDEHEKLWTA